MTTPDEPRTARGRATRDRIVSAAAVLMYERGVAGTSLDDVREASGTSKSQVYHYFENKSALVCAVIAHQQRAVLAGQQPYLGEIETLADLRVWRDRLVAMNTTAMTFGGCPIGGLSSEVADADEDARAAASRAFEEWRSQLAAGLGRLQESGELASEASPEDLSWGLLAASQGGLLLAQAPRRARPLELALDQALTAIEAYAA